MSRRRPAGRHGYGVRGGTSATAGKRAATYCVPLPDGSTRRVRSFRANGAEHCSAWVYWTEYTVPGTHDPATASWQVAAVREERYPGELASAGNLRRVEAIKCTS